MLPIHVVAGSTSDEQIVREKLLSVLEEIGVDHTFSICSAHRNPDELEELVRNSLADGVEAFVGVAGMAAALPGALAALSAMMTPVLAVPLDEHGIDSCLYMPPGVPVFTMGVGSAGLKNAAIGACQIVAINDAPLGDRLRDYLLRTGKPAKLNHSTYRHAEEANA